MALNILILLSGCTSQVIALEPDSRIALVAQEAFGVATALIGLGTILALTPLGSRAFKDGKVQQLESVNNPMESQNPMDVE